MTALAGRLLPGRVRQRLRALELRRAAARRTPPELESALREQGIRVTMDCRLCGCAGAVHRILGHVGPTQAGAFSSRDQRLVQCGACEAIYLDPFPTAEDMKLLYEGSVQFTDACYSDAAHAAQILGDYGRRLSKLRFFPRAGERLLEVGAGLAWVSRACKLHDPGIVTVAQDVSGECVGQCPWVDHYQVGPLESLPVEEAYRLISLTHVIEHLLDPRAMLERLAARLLPGGHLFIAAPFRPPLWKPRDGIRPWLSYSYLHVPAHVSYLSERWFERASRSSGLRLLRWDASHDGHQAFEALLQKPAARTARS
jgi:2-polyprenyl-3-methyl-5-hydroxy-6-metoxy-1,4-benzoquinol methylase